MQSPQKRFGGVQQMGALMQRGCGSSSRQVCVNVSAQPVHKRGDAGISPTFARTARSRRPFGQMVIQAVLR